MVDGQCLHTSPNPRIQHFPAFGVFRHLSGFFPEKLDCKDHLHRVIIAHEDIGIDIPVPIVTPGRMLEFPPTHTLLPNVTGEVKRFPELKRNKIARKTIFYRQTFSL